MLSCVRTTNPKKSKVTISYPGAMLNILVQVPETTLSPPPIPTLSCLFIVFMGVYGGGGGARFFSESILNFV